jgi:hypothetical protein
LSSTSSSYDDGAVAASSSSSSAVVAEEAGAFVPFHVTIVNLPDKDAARDSEVSTEGGHRRLIGEKATVMAVDGDLYVLRMQDPRFDFHERLWFHEYFTLSPHFVCPL